MGGRKKTRPRRFVTLLAGGVLFGCGSTSGNSTEPQATGGQAVTSGASSGSPGVAGSSGDISSGGSAVHRDPPVECRLEPASVTAPAKNPWLEFIPTWVDTICVNIASCCDAATFDPDGCRAHYTSLTSGLANGDPSHYAYDPDAAETCLLEIKTQLAACTNGFGGSCTRVQRGLLRDGQKCQNHRDCVSGVCSDVGAGLECGGRAHAKLGGACAVSCKLDLYGAWSCYGQPSQRDIGQCFAEDGLFCALKGEALGPLDGSGAVCDALHATGTACTSGLECSDGFCVAGRCGPDPGGDLGAACPCKAELTCLDGSCQTGMGFGEACDLAAAPCASGLACNQGTCQCGGYYGSYLMPIECDYN
jgi:hypothetical protein